MADIKTGDPKLRAFVDQALGHANDTLNDGDFGYTDAEQYQKALLEAVVPILKTWQTGDAPYVQTHVIAIAEAIVGTSYDNFYFKRDA